MKGLIELLKTETQLVSGRTPQPSSPGFGHKVFVVHGQNGATLHETARFLERLEQEVMILREQPNQGRTIIEKFEDYSDVGFAVVLLTPDDHGGEASKPHSEQKPRARQNVIFELGYFIGQLGRKRVCALYAPGVEIPSDYSGVFYIELDKGGGWKISLAKEMKAAGLPVDLNKAV